MAPGDWKLPHLADPQLLAEIGPTRLKYFYILIEGETSHRPVIVKFDGIKLGQAIEYLGRMGVETLEYQSGDSMLEIRLDGPYTDYSYALVEKDGELTAKVKLQ